MLTDILENGDMQRHPPLIRHYTNFFWPCYRAGPYYRIWFLVLSHFWTCVCSNVETNLSWTCLVSGLLSFEHPSVLLFCFLPDCESFVTVVACQQRTLTFPDTWPCPSLDLVYMFLCWDQSLPNMSCLRTFEFQTSLDTSISIFIYYLFMGYVFYELAAWYGCWVGVSLLYGSLFTNVLIIDWNSFPVHFSIVIV